MIVASNDWIGSIPVFYNVRTNKIGNTPNEILSKEDLEWDIDGLADYLDFGYCVFGRTPFKNIRFLQANEKLYLENNLLRVYRKDDTNEVSKFPPSTVQKVHHLFQSKTKRWLNDQSGIGILPLSGGFDSRWLALEARKNDVKLDCFTYAFYKKDHKRDSKELNYAKWVSNQLNFKWEEIEIDSFWKYRTDWFNHFGFSTHFHGMYHLEFYDKINSIQKVDYLLSGIIGDAWAGSVNINSITSWKELTSLAYSHGMNASSKHLLEQPMFSYRKAYFEEHQQLLRSDKGRVIASMRIKMMLLRYLFLLPQKKGWSVYTPFLDKELALSMLFLPETEKKNRKWQKEYFQKNNLYPEDILGLQGKNHKFKVLETLQNTKLEPIRSTRLCSVFEKKFVKKINSKVNQISLFWSKYYQLRNTRFHPLVKHVIPIDNRLEFYHAYLTLKSLDDTLLKFE